MTPVLEALVTGIGFWSPRLPGWEAACAILAGLAEPPATPQPRVAPAMLAPTERRRAPDTVAIGMEVASQACAMAGREPGSLASVFASTHGDLPINDYMCSTLADNPLLCSPTKFHNSVHNAVSGYWTIGSGSMKPSTAITAWHDTFAAGLLEALVQVATGGEAVLYAAYDVAARGPLAAVTPSEGLLAAALVLAPPGERPATPCARLRASLGQGSGDATAGHRAGMGCWEELLPANAMRNCVPLFAALAAGGEHRMRLGLGAGTALRVELGPVSDGGSA